MNKFEYPPRAIFLTPFCEKCDNVPGEMEILWSTHDTGDHCDLCDRKAIRYVLDKRCLTAAERREK